jgi:hypothetical protein
LLISFLYAIYIIYKYYFQIIGNFVFFHSNNFSSEKSK